MSKDSKTLVNVKGKSSVDEDYRAFFLVRRESQVEILEL